MNVGPKDLRQGMELAPRVLAGTTLSNSQQVDESLETIPYLQVPRYFLEKTETLDRLIYNAIAPNK